MIKGVLFDLDGTLLDDEKYTILSKVLIGKNFGYDIKVEDARKTLGLSNKNSDAFLKSIYGEDVPVNEFRKARTQMIIDHMKEKGLTYKPGVNEILDYLSSNNIKKAICTSTVQSFLEEYKKYGNLFDRFDAIVSGDSVKVGKPNPDIFLKGAEMLGLKVNECLVVEDAASGIEAGLRGGFKVIAIPDLSDVTKYIENDGVIVLKSLIELVEYLKSNR